MTMPRIRALGIVQDGAPTRWKASGHVEGVGWLEAWGPSLIAAMEQLQKMAEARLAARQSAPCRGEQNGG